MAISEYDQNLFEDERVNRMHESIVLFDSLCNSNGLQTPHSYYFEQNRYFRKQDQKNPLKNYFPDYDDKPDDTNEAIKFSKQIFENKSNQ